MNGKLYLPAFSELRIEENSTAGAHLGSGLDLSRGRTTPGFLATNNYLQVFRPDLPLHLLEQQSEFSEQESPT